MQILSSTDTINQGRVKVNDCIDHTVTGATAGTSPGSIDFKSNSGLYNFTTQINFPNITEGGIIDGMVVTQDTVNPLKWIVSSGTYMVGGQPYTYGGGGVTLSVGPSASVSPGRADLIIATSAGVTTIAGSANSTTPATPFYQESSQLPLAVIIVSAGAVSTSALNTVVRSNMNFGGRMNPAGSDPLRHSINGYNGSNSKMSINMANQGYMNSQYSYIFGGTNNMMSGTSVILSAGTVPDNTIVGGTNNLISGLNSKFSGIFGSNNCKILNGINSNIFGSRNVTVQEASQSLYINTLSSFFFGQNNSNFIGTQFCTGYTNTGTGNLMLNCDYSTLSQGVQDCGMMLTSYSYLSGSSSNSGIFAGRDSNLDAVNYCATIGGSYNFISNSTDSIITGTQNTASTTSVAFISGKKNIISNALYSTIVGGSGNTITTERSAMFNCLNTNLNNNSGQVAIATNGYNDAGITLPEYTLITDAHKINKELILGVEVVGSGVTNTTSRIIQAIDPTGGGAGNQHLLPANPYDGELHIIKDAAGTASGLVPIEVSGNGHNIDGASTYDIDTAYQVLRVVFSSSYNKWLIV